MDSVNNPGKRQEKRDSLFLSATVSIVDRAPLITRVRNLSAGGMMIDAPDDVAVGTPLVADIRGLGAVTGRIAWSAAGRAGVAFDREVDPRQARTGPAAKSSKVVTPDFLKPVPGRRPGLAVR